MNQRDAREVLLLHAIEVADEKEEWLTAEAKSDAATHAGAPLPRPSKAAEEDQFLAKRAAYLLKPIVAKSNSMSKWLGHGAEGHGFTLIAGILFLAAVAAGYLTNELGPEKRINVLSFPLIGIIAWSLLVYLGEILVFIRQWKNPNESGVIHALFLKVIRNVPEPEEGQHPEEKIIHRALHNFQRVWQPLMLPIRFAKVKSLLHGVAFVLAASAIAGMYVKGLANEYRAVWESTFFSSGEQLRPFLTGVLGPAAALTNTSLPAAADLNAIHWRQGGDVVGENAARWIHWYAITISIYVLIPRFVLSLVWRIKAAMGARNIAVRQVDRTYFDRLLSLSSGSSVERSILPYGIEMDSALKERAKTGLENWLKRSVTIDWLPEIRFGEEEDIKGADTSSERPLLLMNFAATPEVETHKVVGSGLLNGGEGAVVILLDTKPFREKLVGLGDAEARLEQRLLAWKELFPDDQFQLVLLGVS